MHARHNIYGFIHKALRHFLSDTLVALGRLDVADAQETDTVLAQARQLLALCRMHLEHENRFVHPALEACDPGSASRIAGEHVHHEEDIALLLGQVDAVDAARGDASACMAAAGRLYRHMAVFVGDNFVHMDYEEREHNATLWAHYTDMQLHAIEGAIVAALTPATSALSMRWMLPALSHPERVGLLQGMRANAPAAAFGSALTAARERLGTRDWDKLSASLGLEQAVAA
ncbi:hypothetical protein [Frateuria terrea]|uniref:Hemerythrin HHE cation binding domain-containing protein n=1 Tax=Frateuria terrea TaxID=529704 RepID=A0A1H6SKA2_9GAMM|nr:hypothetical protein [Frateuria terrea]SEI63892.1 hypothetical protein SAMN04487997_1287 [Frateuria terrea]SFP24301.1 hypothetical protein SAMN02927913_1202 [Frateuria terrea]